MQPSHNTFTLLQATPVHEFVEDRNVDSIICGGRKKTQECFRVLRDLVHHGGGGSGRPDNRPAQTKNGGGGTSDVKRLESQIAQLNLEVQQRDREIGILVEIVNRGEKHAPGNNHPHSTMSTRPAGLLSGSVDTVTTTATASTTSSSSSSSAAGVVAAPSTSGGPPGTSSSGGLGPVPTGREAAELLLDRAKAFEVFRRSVRRNETFEENKELLRSLYTQAKAIGEQANDARQRAAATKTRIQQLRVSRAIPQEDGAGAPPSISEEPPSSSSEMEGGAPAAPPEEEEEELLASLDQHKAKYTDTTNQLRSVKHMRIVFSGLKFVHSHPPCYALSANYSLSRGSLFRKREDKL